MLARNVTRAPRAATAVAAVTNNGLALEYAELKDEDIVKAAKEEIANYKGGQTRKRKRTPTEQVEHEK